MRRLVTCVGVALISSLSFGGCSGNGATTGVNVAPGTSQTVQALVRAKVKHVFVLIQENHTFDNYFGVYPGTAGQAVENLGTSLANSIDCVPDPQTGGCQRPFLITTNANSPNYVIDAPDIAGGDNSRNGQEASINHGAMNGFLSLTTRARILRPSDRTRPAAQIAVHNEAIGIESVYDCDTVPYLWYYAKNFSLYDHYFQANTGPSTPSNIQLFAAQTGQTQAANGQGSLTMPVPGGYSDGVPISNDDNPPQTQLSFIPAFSGPDSATYQSYSTMPVLLNPPMDQAALTAGITGFIPDDLKQQGNALRPSTPWGWYEEGLYTANAGFSAHHTAPLYFDYINKNRFAVRQHLDAARQHSEQRADLRHPAGQSRRLGRLLGQGRQRQSIRFEARRFDLHQQCFG